MNDKTCAPAAWMAGASWARHGATGKIESWPVEPGAFPDDGWLTADFFNPGDILLQLCLFLQARDSDRRFRLFFGLYPGVRARLRLPARALQLNAWTLKREAALLKPKCGGDTVLPGEIAALTLEASAMIAGEGAWWQTPWRFTKEEPPLLERAESSHGQLLDDIGQAAFRHWPQKTAGREAMIAGLRRQAAAGSGAFPEEWSKWGGWKNRSFEASGFFRTEHDGKRWWLVDPEGCAFWSAGINCARPQIESGVDGLEHLLPAPIEREANGQVNFLAANFRRAFGGKWPEAWQRITLDFLRGHGFNTFGNWSEWKVAAAAGFPYTRPLDPLRPGKAPLIFRDFPDVWHPDFADECARWAEQLRETADDPALVGYFLTNEPAWCFAKQTPSSGMLANTEDCHTRRHLAGWLRGRYATDDALARAWGEKVSFVAVEKGRWALVPGSEGFQRDMEEYSGLMATRLFHTMAEACRRVAPRQLNLGARFAFLPPEWMMEALGFVDVFSFNSYSKTPREHGGIISTRLRRPVLIGEWHFGAMDAGQPSGAVETVARQDDRAVAYRNFVESHAALPWVVGTHWFTLYDQSAIGRADGECYNIGFLDVCNRPYPAISRAARETHGRIYRVAQGNEAPFFGEAKYHPRVSV